MAKISSTEFSIAMKLAAEAYLDERVSEFMRLDSSYIVPSKKIERKIYQAIHRDKQKWMRAVCLKTVKVAFMVFVGSIVLIFSAAMCIQPIRAAFIDAVRTWYDNRIEFDYIEVNSNEEEFKVMMPTYIPKGWEVTDVVVNKFSFTCDMYDEAGYLITYQQSMIGASAGYSLDNTDCEEKSIVLKDGSQAYLYIYEDGRYVLLWVNDYKYCISTENLSYDELLRMVESIEEY